jgi:hypothetical protein
MKPCPVREVDLNNFTIDSSIVDESTEYTNRNSLKVWKPCALLGNTRNRFLSEKRVLMRTVEKVKPKNPEEKRYSCDFIPTVELRKKRQFKGVKQKSSSSALSGNIESRLSKLKK